MSSVILQDVTEILGGLLHKGVTVWIDGGWCVDALVGRELRRHEDIDLAVSRSDESALRNWLAERGFAQRPDEDSTAWNFVPVDARSREVDVHVFEFDERGDHVYGVEYPAASLTGKAMLGGLDVNCIAPEYMFRFKTAYAPAPKDLLDIQSLVDTFGFELPPTHRVS